MGYIFTRISYKSVKYQPKMLSQKLKAPLNAIFRIPAINMDMTWENIVAHYPHMTEEMDGTDIGGCLMVYYCKNPVNGIYEFVDEDAEADMIDIFGFDVDICTKGESKQEAAKREKQQPLAFEYDDDTDDEYHNLPEFNETQEKYEINNRKQQKKERRQKLVDTKNNTLKITH